MNSHKTAIHRGHKLSAPMRYLWEHDLLSLDMLDYGCGHGDDAGNLNGDFGFRCSVYDPYYQPVEIENWFKVVTCIYVLNVIEYESERREVIEKVKARLCKGGVAFFAIRSDHRNLNGRTSKGTWQGYVKDTCEDADMYLVHRNSNFEIWGLLND